MRLTAGVQCALLMTLAACGRAGPPPDFVAQAVVPEVPQPAAPPAEQPVDTRKIIKTVELSLEVSDTSATADKIQHLVPTFGGYVSSLSANEQGERLYYRIAVRVAVRRLEEAVKQFKQLSTRVRNESIQTEDVTARFVDLEARLKTLLATEDELRALLAESRDRKQSAKEIMEVYKELTAIRTDVEQTQGQLRLVENQTSLSTVIIDLIPSEAAKPIVQKGWNPVETVRARTRELVSALQMLADFAIGFIIVFIPLALMAAVPLVLATKLLIRTRRRYTS